MENAVITLLQNNVTPLIAHPERFPAYSAAPNGCRWR
jgi:tyrosine-protein phosphatase YwqE